MLALVKANPNSLIITKLVFGMCIQLPLIIKLLEDGTNFKIMTCKIRFLVLMALNYGS